MNILVSACLLGVDCKYNGHNNLVEQLMESYKGAVLIPVCPEQLGGLTTPRPPAEIQEGNGSDVLQGNARVKNNQGADVTEQFIKGAEETLKIAHLFNCHAAILKERSPSCGGQQIYTGKFEGRVKSGVGVTAELLKKNGIQVFSEENYGELIKNGKYD